MSSLTYIKITDFVLETGQSQTIQLSYQLFGQPLHEAPVIMVNHALTANSNVCGEQGWWSDLIGEKKCIDTRYYTILAFNMPGNGFDSVQHHLIENYKDFTARTVARIFAKGLEILNINNLYALIGGSVGGGIAWELAVLKPDLAEHIIPIASDWKSTDWIIANCHIQDAILNHSSQPLADARMHAMTLYRTPESLTSKFHRSEITKDRFNVESWLDYHGKALNKRFHLAAYKLMNQILKTIDITKDRADFIDLAQTIKGSIHIVTIPSDLFFKADENWKTYVDLKLVKPDVFISEIKSIHGHDAFLIEFDQLSKILKPVFNCNLVTQYQEAFKKCS
ncbi:MAG: alpha/beta fold hydrolase [Psychroserpens sp.]|nr:alpha/beta fold hydrolase [Psychroserpens sp.]